MKNRLHELVYLAGNANSNGYGMQDGNTHYTLGSYGNNELDYKQQVVAVGTPLPSTSLPQGNNGMKKFSFKRHKIIE